MIDHSWIDNAVACLWQRSEILVNDDDGYPCHYHVVDQEGWDAAILLGECPF